MDEFLKDYITMIADSDGRDITPDHIHDLICDVENNEEIWNIIDEFIMNKMDEYEIPYMKEEPQEYEDQLHLPF